MKGDHSQNTHQYIHAATQNAQAATDKNACLPEEEVAHFDGAPAALNGREDNVRAARAQQRIHVGNRAGGGQVTCHGGT